jgi:hypothetical protein
MLTFEDFKIDYPQLVGMVRGTGTDFRWVGELQAAAARTPFGTIGGLFLSDAVAEYKEEKLTASFQNARARAFSSEDFDAENLQVSGIRLDSNEGVTTVSAPNASAGRLKGKTFDLENVRTRNLRVRDQFRQRTDIQADQITSSDARLEDTRLQKHRRRTTRASGTHAARRPLPHGF